MSAHLRFRVRSGDACILQVRPGDGRYQEEFRVTAAELRRFAWAALAQLDPDEARATAAEQGDTIEALTRPVEGMGRSRHKSARSTSAPPPGTKKHQVLVMLRGGAHTAAAISVRLPHVAKPGALMWELRQSGFARRADLGGPGEPALYELTDLGRALFPRQTSEAA